MKLVSWYDNEWGFCGPNFDVAFKHHRGFWNGGVGGFNRRFLFWHHILGFVSGDFLLCTMVNHH